ncbi:hypothetical protein L3X38_028933 [Prunus dulcis]|uniref:Uncharacterized protein n=1 Tax=Prunus dulcis TaxID=3755 RepID=A0AAD4VT47_PRUDU|nr:hypothetical protein L3X38_028933 [Prunus dulcis]
MSSSSICDSRFLLHRAPNFREGLVVSHSREAFFLPFVIFQEKCCQKAYHGLKNAGSEPQKHVRFGLWSCS